MNDTVAPGARPGRGVRIALAVSVALNLAVAGLVVGSTLTHRGERPGPVRDLGLGAFTEVMTKEQRASLRQVYKRQSPDFGAMRREMRAERAALLASLRAQPFDPEAFGRALTEMNARHAGRLHHGELLLQEVIAGMAPDERLAFADRLQSYLNQNRGAPRDRGEGPEEGRGDGQGDGSGDKDRRTDDGGKNPTP